MEMIPTPSPSNSRKFVFRRRKRRPSVDSSCSDSTVGAGSRIRRGTAILRRLPRRIPRSVQSPMLVEEENNHEDDTRDKLNTTFALENTKPPLPTATTVIQLRSDKTVSSLPEALELWWESVGELCNSEALARVMQSSQCVLLHTGKSVVHILLLPLTIPQHVCCKVADFAAETAACVVQGAMEQMMALEACETIKDKTTPVVATPSLPNYLLGVTTKLVVAVVVPLFLGSEDESTSRKKLDYPGLKKNGEYPDYLDKLRLDFVPKHLRVEQPQGANSAVKSSEDALETSPLDTTESTVDSVEEQSQFLLRIDDLGLKGKPRSISLHPESRESLISQEVFDALTTCAFCLLASNSTCARALELPKPDETAPTHIKWNPEGPTKKLERQLLQEGHPETQQLLLSTETLVWSGRFVDPSPPRKSHMFYMARGLVPLTPLKLIQLLWNNDRVQEYNPYCLGRITVLSIGCEDADNLVLRDGDIRRATKVIQTKMRVAGLTVTSHNLMHVKHRGGDGSYIMVGRTLDARKNQVIWNCSVLLPRGDAATELMSLSQVASNVPQFVAHKIGLTGIADFFRKVRAL